MKYTQHSFGPSETIRGIIRKYNGEDISEEMLNYLLEKYNELNNNEVPRLGKPVKIPLYE